MPYRTDDSGADSGLSILMVTSRETRRWVIPKGNLMASHAPHEAAAIEALEEAGVRGRISRSPSGRYQYLKKLDTGVSVPIEVDVYPLAVTEELAEWKEQHQRERRWVPQAEAADSVDEPDLAKLIRSFRAPQA